MMYRPASLHRLGLITLALVLQACGTNPVTGEKELQLISRSAEIRLGEENYLYTQQSQGGAYRIDPDLTRYVNGLGQRLAKVSDRPDLPYEFTVINDSTPNAWALPGGKIGVNRGLLVELDSEAELAAVLGHEVVHAAARHGAKNIERSTLLQLGVVAIGSAVADSDYAKHKDLVVGAAALGAGLITSRYSREAELEADRYGMRYMARAGYNPQAAVALQETFVRLAEGRNQSWLEGLFASHPPSQERVEANRRIAAELGPEGRLGREDYQARIAHLKQTQSAYARYQEGRAALTKDRFDQALRLADEAIAMEPRQALFYALKGDARLQQGRFDRAITHYGEALERNDQLFYYYRQRGIARERLGQRAGARQDLERSLELLPTALAHYALGELARQANNMDEAVTHYRSAANDQSDTGREAFRKLVHLDLPRNPGQYLSVQAGPGSGGRLEVQVRNRTPVALGSVVLRVTTLTSGGRPAAQETIRLARPIGPQRTAQQATGLAARDTAGNALKVRVEVIEAQAQR